MVFSAHPTQSGPRVQEGATCGLERAETRTTRTCVYVNTRGRSPCWGWGCRVLCCGTWYVSVYVSDVRSGVSIDVSVGVKSRHRQREHQPSRHVTNVASRHQPGRPSTSNRTNRQERWVDLFSTSPFFLHCTRKYPMLEQEFWNKLWLVPRTPLSEHADPGKGPKTLGLYDFVANWSATSLFAFAVESKGPCARSPCVVCSCSRIAPQECETFHLMSFCSIGKRPTFCTVCTLWAFKLGLFHSRLWLVTGKVAPLSCKRRWWSQPFGTSSKCYAPLIPLTQMKIVTCLPSLWASPLFLFINKQKESPFTVVLRSFLFLGTKKLQYLGFVFLGHL